MKQLLLAALLAACAGPALAHETMFGLGPRTIWNRGLELEIEQEIDWAFRYFSGNNPDENPEDRRMLMYTIQPGMTYGFHRDFAMRVETPFYTMRERSKRGIEVFSGTRKFSVAATYRFFNNPYAGGSTKAAWFGNIDLPTATNQHGELTDDDFDDNWRFTWGLSVSTSSTRHYLWLDLAGRASTQIEGRGAGPEAQAHLAYAFRFFEITNYKDFDMILLVEADARFEGQGVIDQDRNENSGGYFIHAALGIQMNITNRVELKFGANVPVYKYLFGRQFYHEGEFMLMFSYLI